VSETNLEQFREVTPASSPPNSPSTGAPGERQVLRQLGSIVLRGGASARAEKAAGSAASSRSNDGRASACQPAPARDYLLARDARKIAKFAG